MPFAVSSGSSIICSPEQSPQNKVHVAREIIIICKTRHDATDRRCSPFFSDLMENLIE